CPKRRQLGCRATAQLHCRLCKPHRRTSFDHLVGTGEQRGWPTRQHFSPTQDVTQPLSRLVLRQVALPPALKSEIPSPAISRFTAIIELGGGDHASDFDGGCVVLHDAGCSPCQRNRSSGDRPFREYSCR